MLKTLPKILIIIFLIQLASLVFLLVAPATSQAIEFKPQVTIPDTDFTKDKPYIIGDTTAPIAEYIKAIYKYALGIVGILAAVIMMFGGLLWLTAGGNSERVANAKSWLMAALTGLVLALTSYLILWTVNPALVNFKVTGITPVDEIQQTDNVGCCLISANKCSDTTESNCKDKYPDSSFNLNQDCNSDRNKCVDESPPGCCVLLSANTNPQTSSCRKNRTQQWCEGTAQSSPIFTIGQVTEGDINCESSNCDEIQ